MAGTHGKTTTAGMLAHALRAIGADPGFLLGGELPGAGDDGGPANAGWGDGEWVVAEADESDASFLRLRPDVAAVTNVELDHHHAGARGPSCSTPFAASVSRPRRSRCPPTAASSPWPPDSAWSVSMPLAPGRRSSCGSRDATTS